MKTKLLKIYVAWSVCVDTAAFAGLAWYFVKQLNGA